MIESSFLYPMVEGMSATAAALSSTPHDSSVSNVRLSVATTEVSGRGMVCEPLLSSTVTDDVEGLVVSFAELWLVAQPVSVRAATAIAAMARERARDMRVSS